MYVTFVIFFYGAPCNPDIKHRALAQGPKAARATPSRFVVHIKGRGRQKNKRFKTK
jgi:hypothetical protein